MSVMRTTLIALSKNKQLQDLIVRIPVSRQMARRFVAGERLEDAITAVQSLNAQGMLATLDHLGENVASEAEAIAAADEYLVALDALFAARAGLQRLSKAHPDGPRPGRGLLFRQRQPHRA